MSEHYSIAELHKLWEEKMDKKGRSNKAQEHQLQVQCVRWFRTSFPEFDCLFWSIPNGGYRSKKTASDMKAEGQRAGVPDLFFAMPAHGYCGLFIEMKKAEEGKRGGLVRKGKTSENQDEVIAALRAAGYRVEICYSFDQFRSIINEHLS